MQHVGSSFTQLADQEPNFGLIADAARGRQVPRVSSRSVRRERHPDPVRCRAAFVRDRQSALGHPHGSLGGRAVYVNNLWDERAFLSIDRERGRSARVGYLTNPPRTYGVNFRMNF